VRNLFSPNIQTPKPLLFFSMASNIYSLASPPVFTGENYQMWAVRMKTYLQACDF
jgi:hypothetical protein